MALLGQAAYNIAQNIAQDPQHAAQVAQARQQHAAQLAKAPLQGRDEEDSELYSNYKPAWKVDARPHPHPIVETPSLAGVTPPEPKYQHHLQVCFCNSVTEVANQFCPGHAVAQPKLFGNNKQP